VLGAGAELRGDDFAGVLVARAIEKWRRSKKIAHVRGFEGCAAPENLTGEIARFRPSHVLVVDAAHLSLEPGEVRMIPADSVAGTSFSTHMLPMRIVLDYLKASCGCRALVAGIQPEQTDVMGPISKKVRRAIEAVVATVQQGFRSPRRRTSTM
jgi:hydrogenase 3 maturation protease